MEPHQATVRIALQGMGDAEGAARIALKGHLRILPGMIGQRAVRPDADLHHIGRQGTERAQHALDGADA